MKFYCVFEFSKVMCYCFVLCSINQQVLFHLSQITPRRHTIRLKESKSNRKTTKTTKNDYERLCQESFCEAFRNFQASTNAAILDIPLSSITNLKPLARQRSQTGSTEKCLHRLENTIKMSYVSRNSFAENKAEPMLDSHESVGISHPNTVVLAANLIRQLSQPMMRDFIQIRGFRTQRNIESQLKRNPSFMSRFQQYFGKYLLFV